MIDVLYEMTALITINEYICKQNIYNNNKSKYKRINDSHLFVCLFVFKKKKINISSIYHMFRTNTSIPWEIETHLHEVYSMQGS